MNAANDESVLLNITGGEGAGGGGAGASEGVVEEVALKKGPWTAAEDAILIDYVTKHGEGNWNAVQKNTGLARCGKSCRLRWANHLRPNLKKGAFSPEEEKLILELHAQYGNKWARMAALLPGRTDNEIKNYWNTRVKRRQRQGLPLYSDDLDHPTTPTRPTTSSAPVTPTGQTTSTATQFDFLHQHHHPLSPTPPPHSPLSSPLQPKPTFSALPESIPLSSPSPSRLSFIFNRPAPVLSSPLGFKRYRTSSGYPLQVAPSNPSSAALLIQPVTTQLGGYSGFGFPAQLNSSSSQMYQTPLLESNQGGVSCPSVFSTKLELPSNQYSQPIEPEMKFDMQVNDPALKTSNGLLGDLLFEAQALASGQTTSKKRSYLSLNEGNDIFDGYQGFDDLPLSSAYWSSSAGMKLKEEAPDLSKSMNDDLSSLLSVMPSTTQVPDWHNGSAAEVSNVQSSGVMPDDIFGLDMKPIASLFPITSTTNHNDNSGCFSWDNLPGLC